MNHRKESGVTILDSIDPFDCGKFEYIMDAEVNMVGYGSQLTVFYCYCIKNNKIDEKGRNISYKEFLKII